MSLRTDLRPWTISLFGALGLASTNGCGGATEDGSGGTRRAAFADCDEATSVLGPDGTETGYIQCSGGWMHRAEQRTCPSSLPRAAACVPSYEGAPSDCTTDADCTLSPNGHCIATSGFDGPSGCYCAYGCTTDAECGNGRICLCGDPVGYCVSATCEVDADCGDGYFCSTYVMNPGCGGTAFACQEANDQCASDSDCLGGQQCTYANGRHECMEPTCVIGRPFLVLGEERLAPIALRDDWCAPLGDERLPETGPAKGELAARWARIGLMEHASIAAFARFAMQLLSLGAPPDLIAATHAAMADETEHARLAFGLASAFAGRAVGPGPLAVDDALSGGSLMDVVATTIREGCIGETIAAIEASEALAHATEPAVRAVLARVKPDETRHAELAWRFVQWALDVASPGERRGITELVRSIYAAELEAAHGAVDCSDGPLSARGSALLAGGILPEPHRAELRLRVLAEVISPCIDALLDDRGLAGDPIASRAASLG